MSDTPDSAPASEEVHNLRVLAPKFWSLTTALFTTEDATGRARVVSTELVDEAGPYTLEIGGFDDFDEGSEKNARENPMLTANLAVLLLALLSLFQPGEYEQDAVTLSWGELFRRCTSCSLRVSANQRQIKLWKANYIRLRNIRWRQRRAGQAGAAHRLLAEDAVTPQHNNPAEPLKVTGHSLEQLKFRREFLQTFWPKQFVGGKSQLQDISLTALKSISDERARACFFWAARDAVQNPESRPARRDVSDIYKAHGWTLPKHKSEVEREIFGRNKAGGWPSQLDRQPFAYGGYTRIWVEANAAIKQKRLAGAGYNLCLAQVGVPPKKPAETDPHKRRPLQKETGLVDAAYDEAVQQSVELSLPETQLLEAAGVTSEDLPKVRVSFLHGKKLLGLVKFADFLRDMELASFRRRGGRIQKAPVARVIHYLRERVAEVRGNQLYLDDLKKQRGTEEA